MSLCGRGQSSPPFADAASGDGQLHDPLAHHQQRAAHRQVQQDGAEDQQQANDAVQDEVGGGHGVVFPPVDEAPGFGRLQCAIRHAHHWEAAKEDVTDVDEEQKLLREASVHSPPLVGVRAAYGQVSLCCHGAYDAESGQTEKQQQKGLKLADMLVQQHIGVKVVGYSYRTGQASAQQVRHRQPAHQRVES